MPETKAMNVVPAVSLDQIPRIEAPKPMAPQVTTQLPPLGHGFTLPNTLFELFETSAASSAGYSAVSGWHTCPESQRLKWLGVSKRAAYQYHEVTTPEDLDPLYFGILMHACRAARLIFGADAPYICLNKWRAELTDADYWKAWNLFKLYDELYPLGADPFDYLGVEVEVRTDIRSRDGLRPCIRTVRYDTVVKLRDGSGVVSFEAKTMARSGYTALSAYFGQGICQMAIWNANHELVRQHGPMRSVLYDCYIKTNNPNVQRDVQPFSRVQQQMGLEYLRSTDDQVKYEVGADGKYFKALHSCWGRWRPCQFINACHDQAYGDYQYADGRPYDGK